MDNFLFNDELVHELIVKAQLAALADYKTEWEQYSKYCQETISEAILKEII